MADSQNCKYPPLLAPCCIEPKMEFFCPQYKHNYACIAGRVSGAYLPYSVSYFLAVKKCKEIQQSSSGGTNKQFGKSFATSFK